MQISDIVAFWRGEQAVDGGGRWAHRLDRSLLISQPNSFNLDHPVCPYVGNIVTAPVIILSSNAGYDSTLTPAEFPEDAATKSYVSRVDYPEGADWSSVSSYYHRTNYGQFIASGQAVLINVSPYRSPSLKDEPENQRLLPTLPTTKFVRRWLFEAVLPLAETGERLVALKRGQQWWHLPTLSAANIIVEPNPRFPSFGKPRIAAITDFLATRH